MKPEQLIENVAFMHKDHRNWLSQLNFYQDEIKFFQNELVNVIHSHMNSLSIIESVDEYKSIFLKKLARIDDLRHQITKHELELASTRGETSAYHEMHQQTRSDFMRFVEEFEMMKKNFKRFAAYND